MKNLSENTFMLGLVVLYLTEWNLFVLICKEEKELELRNNSMSPIVLIIILSLLLIPKGTHFFILYVEDRQGLLLFK